MYLALTSVQLTGASALHLGNSALLRIRVPLPVQQLISLEKKNYNGAVVFKSRMPRCKYLNRRKKD